MNDIKPHPLVVHCKKSNFDIYIGRKHKDFPTGSKWANPFYLKDESERDIVIKQYISYLLNNEELLKQIPELKGKILGCWCRYKDRICHGDVLALLSNDESLYVVNN